MRGSPRRSACGRTRFGYGRSDFGKGGVEALEASIAPGPPPVKSETALRVVTPLLDQPVADRTNWTIARLSAEIEAREGVRIRRSQLSKALRKKLPLATPPAHAEGTTDRQRGGLRLQLRKRQAEAGDIVLLYGDESEALTHPYLARAWAKAGADLRVPAPGQAKKVAMLGSLDHVTRRLIVHTSPSKRSTDFVAHLEQLDELYGPKPGRPAKPVVLGEDNGPIHVSKLSLAALAARAHWLTVEWLPKYAPELNDIEAVWRDLKAHHLAHQTFTDVADLDQARDYLPPHLWRLATRHLDGALLMGPRPPKPTNADREGGGPAPLTFGRAAFVPRSGPARRF